MPANKSQEQKGSEQTSEEQEKDSPVLEQLRQLSREIKWNTTASKFVEDPDVLKLLSKKSRGEKFRIVDGDDEGSDERSEGRSSSKADELDESVDLEGMSNRELLKHMEKMYEKRLKAALKEQEKPLKEQINMLASHLQARQQEAVNSQWAELKSRYKDAEALGADIVQLHQTAPGLNLEELYHVAKRRKQGDVAGANLFSEKPTSNTSRPSASKELKKPENITGRRGLDEMLRYASTKVLDKHSEAFANAGINLDAEL